MNPKLSILIPTIYGREALLDRLTRSLNEQIKNNNFYDKVEICILKDKRGESTIGAKRNNLLQNCRGDYAAFVDCDDRVSINYLKLILDKLENENPDVVRLEGIITKNGNNPKRFIHSLEFNSWFEKQNVYYRNPNHLNTIKTSISKKFFFKDISFGEDKIWSEEILNSNLLKKESKVYDILYYYDYITNK